MALETVPDGIVSDGNVTILFVPTIADPSAPTVTELTGAGVIPLTYAGSGDGYKHTVTIDSITRDRFTLKQALSEEGTITHAITYTAVYTNDPTDDPARAGLAQGTTGYVVERLGVANGTAFDADQVVTVIPVKGGYQSKDAPVKNQELTYTQNLSVTGIVQDDVSVVAAS